VHTIGEGLALARPDLSDSVFVAEGTYVENHLTSPSTTILQGGYPRGGGARDLTAHPVIVMPVPNDASSPFELLEKGVTVDGFAITGIRHGLGPVEIAEANVTLRSLRIVRNRLLAGVACVDLIEASSGVTMDRCIIAQNSVNNAHGVVSVGSGATLHMIDCDIVANVDQDTTGATGVFGLGPVTMENTIVWALQPVNVPVFGSLVYPTYSDIHGGWPGTGNLATDPLFCFAREGNYTLHASSPLVGAGSDGGTIGAFGVGCAGAAAAAPQNAGDTARASDKADDAWDVLLDGEDTARAASGGVDSSDAASEQTRDVGASSGARDARTALLSTPSVASRSATLRYALAGPSRVELTVFDVTGAVVRSLVASEQPRGVHDATWDLTDTFGRRVPAGMYVLRFRAGDISEQRRMFVLR
jgi:hypothetical protein